MSRPILCDDCGAPIEKPFMSAEGENVRVKVDSKADLCLDCVFVRVKRVLGIEEIDMDAIAREVYGADA